MDKIESQCGTIQLCQDRQELASALADRFVEVVGAAVGRSGKANVALSGGSTPKALYSLLAEPAYSQKIAWNKVHLYWGDERCVSHDSPESNYKMVLDSLLSKVPIPESCVHATNGQDTDPVGAARAYEEVLKREFQLSDGNLPHFDLVLLGLGPDGHTASLFPGTEALKETGRLVVANYVEKFKSSRITFTLPVLNAAANVTFMVAGADKQEILPLVLRAEPKDYPAQLIRPTEGMLTWYVDSLAAARIDRRTLAARP
jgi:6-phosphogluconolactonase